IILINPTKYFENVPSIPILCTNPEYLSKIQSNFSNFLKSVKLYTSKVISIENNNLIILQDGTIIDHFDYLIHSPGSRYELLNHIRMNSISIPIINPRSTQQLVDSYSILEKSKNIVIIGSGPTGIEICAEILFKFPKKKLFIISENEYILERCCKP